MDLLKALSDADDVVSRLDERLKRDRDLATSFISRVNYLEAAASLWSEGELVEVDDLVLHDHQMDTQIPSEALRRAADVVDLRRRLSGERQPESLLSVARLHRLFGPWEPKPLPARKTSSLVSDLLAFTESLERDEPPRHALDEEENALPASEVQASTHDDVTDPALANWLDSIDRELPPLLTAARMMVSFATSEPMPRHRHLGPLLAAIELLGRKRTSFLLPIHLGWKAHNAVRIGQAMDEVSALHAIAASSRVCITLCDQLATTRGTLTRAVTRVSRPRTSHVPALAKLFLAAPIVTVPMIEKAFKVGPSGATYLVSQLGSAVQEITLRRTFKAWRAGPSR